MNAKLIIAASALLVTAILHSVLGERYILVRLFRRSDLPRLFGSDVFTRRTLRFAWHVTSVALIGFAAIMAFLAASPTLDATATGVIVIMRWTFVATAIIAFVGSRGRHFSWLLFGTAAAALWLAAP